ncbi:LamG-like jellyroll fold domain-containing protein [Streptomyces xanthophaeus]|uniref:LamG-like jellyroll fold domain-containing protein n=1 Tax=Streptomyces xanthophaeus TaxID=67385 RepID=UPI003659DC52
MLITATMLACAGSLLAPLPAGAAGTEPSDNGQVLFRSGTAGYGCFRIPTVVRTKAGSLLAFAEARTSPSCADRGDIDIVVRRSTDDGRTWSPVRTVTSGNGTDPDAPHTRGNPSPVVDETGDGTIHLLSTAEQAIPVHNDVRTAHVQTSTDDGLGFSAPEPLPRFGDGKGKDWFGTGPSHGIQLTEGPHHGRLVVGAYENFGKTGRRTGFLHKDPGGPWRAVDTALTPPATAKPGEPAVAELPGGDVYIGARNETEGANRTHATSKEGGATVPAHAQTGLKTPNVQASVLTLRRTYTARPRDLMLLTSPTGTATNPDDRANLKVHHSLDKGVTWTAGPTLKTGPAGYSDLAELDNGRIALVYEGGKPAPTSREQGDWSAAHIYFRSLDPRTLGLPAGTTLPAPPAFTAPPTGRTTPDTTPQANDAHLAGAAALDPAAPDGRALRLAADGDHAELPYTRSLDPGSGDFTMSLHFQYGPLPAGTEADRRTLLWAYGMGAGTPQVWIRADPAKNRIWAWAEGSGGSAEAEVKPADPKTAAAFSDGKPHHLTLIRRGNAVELRVDGARGTTQRQVTGTVTGPAGTGFDGIRLGARPGVTTETFKGALDEFRLYRSALTEAQATALRTKDALGTPQDPAPAVRLPFQAVDLTDAPVTTPVSIVDDVSGNGADGTLVNDTYLRHPAKVTGRVDGSALKITANPDAAATEKGKGVQGVQVPFTPSLDIADRDFTYSLWFQASRQATTPQTLLTAYGSSTTAPHLRATVEWDPVRQQHHVLAAAKTVTGPPVQQQRDLPALDPAKPWHLLTLTRSGDTFSLGVDAVLSAPTALTGSFTADATAPFGLRAGSQEHPTLPGKPAAHVLDGLLDDVRLYGNALTEQQIKAMYPVGGPNPKEGIKLRWSMEEGNTQIHEVMRPPAAPAQQSTPDSSRHHNHAYVRDATTHDGRTPTGSSSGSPFGKALKLGADGAVTLPYGHSEALGAGDFTVATLFSHAPEATDSQTIAWAYGNGAAERQLRLRTENVNGQKKITAYVQTDAAEATLSVDAPGAGWHHVALTREGNALKLYVDGVHRQTAPVTGSLTRGDAHQVTGFLLGSRPDGRQHLQGSLDEFRIHRSALGPAEIKALWETNTAPAGLPVVHLPFDTLAEGSYARM